MSLHKIDWIDEPIKNKLHKDVTVEIIADEYDNGFAHLHGTMTGEIGQVPLSSNDCKLLLALTDMPYAKTPKHIEPVSVEHVYREVGYDKSFYKGKAVDMMISRLRRKMRSATSHVAIARSNCEQTIQLQLR